jgi:cation diffusion facilitator CzcD-associated flavoprotein CzcO
VDDQPSTQGSIIRDLISDRGPSIAIIGAGFGGIATAVKLAQAGFRRFTVFEQSQGPGGTWWDNRYPGCAVDIPSHAYSFSFMRQDWRSTHATQPELLQYAHDVLDRFELWSHFRFGTRVDEVQWDDEHGGYVVRTAHGDENFYVVVSCLGLLNVPRIPDWPGLDEFAGPMFHSSRWEHDHDLGGKRVAVIGTGSTSAQVVPAIAPYVGKLFVFQRQPGWIMPKGDRVFTAAERRRFRRYPILQKLRRVKLFYLDRRRFKGFDAGSAMQQELRRLCVDFIDSAIDSPAVRAAVTPDYPWGCKRVVVSSDFYPALNRDNVELVSKAVTRVTRTGVVDSDGVEREVDVLVLATGFQPTKYLASLRVRGPGGIDLHAAWGDEPRAFLGITVAGFPNFFILYGPNTNGGFSIIAQLERQAEVVVRAVARIHRRRAAVDTRPSALDRYVRWIDRQIATHASAMEAGCTNYYHAPTGRNVTQWPRAHAEYYVITKLLPRFGFVDAKARS